MIEFIDEEGIIKPQNRDLGGEVAVTTFSKHLFDALIEKSGAELITTVPGGMVVPVYRASVGGRSVIAYMSPVGAPAAVGALEEVVGGSVKSVVAFGICGALTDIPTRNFIVPTEAFRDEGTSYHYLPPSDSIKIKNSGFVSSALRKYGLKCTEGKVWTTDGFYRETRTRMEKMKGNGCIAVDMECSALQAVCDFRGYDFYTFFITADSLAGDEWEPNYIDSAHIEAAAPDVAAVEGALKIAISL